MLRTEFNVSVTIPTAWGEMDAFNHINNIVYFRYFETARMAYFTKLGYTGYLEKLLKAPILAETSCKFIRALRYPEIIESCVRVSEIGNSSFVMINGIFDQKEALVARGKSVIVHFDYQNQQKASLPLDLKQKIAQIDKLEL